MSLIVLALAVLLDLIFGELNSRWHPVAWVGRSLTGARRWAGKGTPAALLGSGAVLVVGSSLLVAGLVEVLVRYTAPLGWLGLLLQAWLLKCTFSLRGLIWAAREVEAALARGSVDEARHLVGRNLVSRPTAALSTAQVASATVESVAENFTDSVVAPFFFFLLFGLPGAWAYRVVNTADAMWGYREGELEHLGKPAARLDDLLNWVPARLAGASIVLGAFIAGEKASGAWRTMRRDHVRTASPNAGWTMSAMAGALGVGLQKPGAYRIGAEEPPDGPCIDRAIRVLSSSSGLAIALSLVIAALR